MTRARERPHGVVGGGPHTRAAGPPASRRGSSTGLLPDEARAARPRAPKRTPGAPTAASAASRSSTAAEKKRGRCADCPASYDEELFERLRAWRKERADEESVPAFVVFTDATLAADRRAADRPSPAALLRISGVGPAKLDKYGDGVLALVG